MSGQTVLDLCAEQGISPASLARWRKELGYQRAPKQGRRAARKRYSAEERRAAGEAFPRSGRSLAD